MRDQSAGYDGRLAKAGASALALVAVAGYAAEGASPSGAAQTSRLERKRKYRMEWSLTHGAVWAAGPAWWRARPKIKRPGRFQQHSSGRRRTGQQGRQAFVHDPAVLPLRESAVRAGVPAKATYKRESDGLVVGGYDRCIGVLDCIPACPYESAHRG